MVDSYFYIELLYIKLLLYSSSHKTFRVKSLVVIMTTINRSCKISQYPRSSRPEVLCKKVFLKILQNWQETKSFLITLQA